MSSKKKKKVFLKTLVIVLFSEQWPKVHPMVLYFRSYPKKFAHILYRKTSTKFSGTLHQCIMHHLMSEKVMTQKMVIIFFGPLTPKWLKISSLVNYNCQKSYAFKTTLKRNKTKQNKVANSFWFQACFYDVFDHNKQIMNPSDKTAIAKYQLQVLLV